MKTVNFSCINSIEAHDSLESIKKAYLPEVCFIGRSNVGKSSFINAILNRKRIATVSNSPGHTKKIFFYTIDNSIILVDLPGYGYAKTNKKKIQKLSDLLNIYFTTRNNLKMIFILVDSRRNLMRSDLDMISFLKNKNLDYLIVFNKADKMSKQDKLIIEKGMSDDDTKYLKKIIFCSAKTKEGIKEIKKEIIKILN